MGFRKQFTGGAFLEGHHLFVSTSRGPPRQVIHAESIRYHTRYHTAVEACQNNHVEVFVYVISMNINEVSMKSQEVSSMR
jgi:hypothetical protein